MTYLPVIVSEIVRGGSAIESRPPPLHRGSSQRPSKPSVSLETCPVAPTPLFPDEGVETDRPRIPSPF